MTAICDLQVLLSSMQPLLNEGVFYFATLPEHSDVPLGKIRASVWEREGLSVVVDEETAVAYGLADGFRAAWITLNIHSDLAAVGLTAAFAAVLAEAGIGCNVVAGHYHDHIFVPYGQAQAAMAALSALQQKASGRM